MDQSIDDISGIISNAGDVNSFDKKPNSNRILRSVRANLIFPVGKLHRSLKRNSFNNRAGAPAAIFCAAVLEYLTAELMQLAGSICKEMKDRVITSQHLKLAIAEDEELNEFVGKRFAAKGLNSHASMYEFLLSGSKSGETQYEGDEKSADNA